MGLRSRIRSVTKLAAAVAAVGLATMSGTVAEQLPKPNSLPQRMFLETEADICVYGGAAGGGKSYGLLLGAAQHMDAPGYEAVIFRRTSPQITSGGSLWDTSVKVYGGLGKPLRGDLEWRFPNGNKLQFRHLQHEENKLAWQGAQLAFIGFDELTHFTESQFFYLVSRLRSVCGVKPHLRATCNPAPGWVKSFLAQWIDEHYSGPGGPARPGELRWFVRINDSMVWDVSREALRERVPELADEDFAPISVTFIPASLADNVDMASADPTYRAKLLSLPLVEMRRLLLGDWEVFEGSFYSEFSESVHTIPPLGAANEYKIPKHWTKIGGLDWGYRDPFAFVLGAIDEQGRLHIVESVSRAGLTNEQQAEQVRAVLARWGVSASECLISADETMWSRKTINGVQAAPDIEAFMKAGLYVAPSKSPRRSGQSQLRELLHDEARDDAGKSGRFVIWQGYNAELVRQLPAIQWSKRGEDSEDNDPRGAASPDGGHWDVLNALRYLFDSRLPDAGESEEQKRQREQEKNVAPKWARKVKNSYGE